VKARAAAPPSRVLRNMLSPFMFFFKVSAMADTE
ncbi:hypothetical protein LCGC14_2256810, partial [marine sediment metagenome]